MYEVEREWITKAGLRASVGITYFGERKNHRCGYVEVPAGHHAHGRDYHDDLLYNIEVHGGLTYSRDAIRGHLDEGGWWFGFDCAHHGDGDIEPHPDFGRSVYPVRSQQYCEDECEYLAKQLMELTTRKEEQ